MARIDLKRNIFIGTSGWSYGHWQKRFYPVDLPERNWLEFYSRDFQTVEINSSFYHLPKLQTFTNWRSKTSKDFIFAVKASRFITHIKKLKNCHQPWQRFIENAKNLREKLGPILFQLPPSFKADPKRLENFLKILSKKYQYVLEPRNESWFNPKIYEILKKYKVSLCFISAPDFPWQEIITSNFIYIRMHGAKSLYNSKYSSRELKKLAQKIKNWQAKKLPVYVYFNNDDRAHAIFNAKELIKLTK